MVLNTDAEPRVCYKQTVQAAGKERRTLNPTLTLEITMRTGPLNTFSLTTTTFKWKQLESY